MSDLIGAQVFDGIEQVLEITRMYNISINMYESIIRINTLAPQFWKSLCSFRPIRNGCIDLFEW